MKIQIMLQTEPPAPNKNKSIEKPDTSIEEEVRQAIEMIDSGHDSYVEWKLLNKLARELRPRKDARSKNLMEMIDPVLQKYGMHGVEEEGE
jgi:Ca2+-binding EF-hand superfamily protein|tara:strand:+ start:3292 stop:3564 length:273 start_codon:yes stop_codon:yes gene_type:complete